MDDLIFQIKDVQFSYLDKFPALCGVNMGISKGEKLAVLGANGSGKSTLLHMLDGLIFPDSGSVVAFGRELKEGIFNDIEFSRYFRSKVGLIFQNPDIQLFCPTVRDDIVFGPLQLGVLAEEVKKRLDEIVDILNIGNLLDRSPHQLSIGEKRKVAFATTLIIEPEVIILDEPTAGLDPLTSRQILDIIIRENERGKTIITATHDLHIVTEIADNVHVFSRDKKIIRFGPTKEVLSDNVLLSETNLIHIHSHKHKDQVHTHSHEHTQHHFHE